MGGLYRVDRPDGSVEFTDAPSGAGRIDALSPEGRARPERESRSYDHKQVKDLIKEVQKRVPKINDYLEYVDYLRSHSPIRFDRVMGDLRRTDPETWLKLQKHPQFRPLRESALGLKAAEKHLSAGIGFATGNVTGSAEKWLETTVKDMMKRDRFGPYAEVLGSKASTLPAAVPTFSRSRLGQYMQIEDARLAKAAKDVAKELEVSRAAIRGGFATAISRPAGVLLDIGLAALDPDMHGSVTNIVVETKLRKAWAAGVLNDEQYETAHNLMSQGKFKDMQDYLSGARVSKP